MRITQIVAVVVEDDGSMEGGRLGHADFLFEGAIAAAMNRQQTRDMKRPDG